MMMIKYAMVVIAMCNVVVAKRPPSPVNSTATTKRYCSRRRNPPRHRKRCSFPVVCEIGTQSCPSGSDAPKRKCECNGKRWSCEKVSCPAEEQPSTFTASSADRAFAVKMNLLTDAVLNGYNTKSELSFDLTQMVRFYVNALIEDQARYDVYAYFQPDLPVASPDVAEDGKGGAVGGSGPSAEGATDFETNNQEEGVDEADMVKSDGKYVYAGYGNILVVWDALTGDLLTNYTLADPVGTDVYDGNVNAKPALGIGLIPYYKPRASILSLSLDSGRLVLYVEGYGQQLRNNISTVFTYDAFATRILVFDTSTLPTDLTLVTQEDIHGSYRDARAIGSNIHVVTTNSIDYYPIQQYLYRWNQEFTGMNATEYKAAAAVIAAPLIDKFVATLEKDITTNGIIPNVPKISIWQTDLGLNTNIIEFIYSSGAIQSFVQLTSFSVKDLQGDLSLSVAGAFTPSSWGYTYAVDGNLVFAAQAWNWNSQFGGSTETTYLLGFELNGASAKPSFLGSVPGYINNQYYMSIFEGHLRVATTVRSFWPIWTQPVEQVDGTFIWPQPITTTNNTVYVYNLPTNTTSMSEVARVPNLGKPGEVFTAIRFFGNICYAVTFEQVDPFYVIQLDPTDVKVLGELEISGFSSYLHSINGDDTLLIAVGQEADSTGRVLGVQITLFDATNPAKPISLQRTVVEQESDVWSSSSIQWDYKSFRWLSLGDEVGILIMPLQVVAYTQEDLTGNFDGFLVYDVSRSGISERLSISHVDSEQFYGCYWRAYLPERSFVFNGNVTTMKGHSVVSTDLDTGKRGWKLDMPSPTTKEDCGYWFF